MKLGFLTLVGYTAILTVTELRACFFLWDESKMRFSSDTKGGPQPSDTQNLIQYTHTHTHTQRKKCGEGNLKVGRDRVGGLKMGGVKEKKT